MQNPSMTLYNILCVRSRIIRLRTALQLRVTSGPFILLGGLKRHNPARFV